MSSSNCITWSLLLFLSLQWRAFHVSSQSTGAGECSFYGEEIGPGSYTACGDFFNGSALAASQLAGIKQKLPCGTKVRVTNVATQKTVDVVLNDKGDMGPVPVHPLRVLDLTITAFKMVGDREKGTFSCSYAVIQ